jgi:hypothetical protein
VQLGQREGVGQPFDLLGLQLLAFAPEVGGPAEGVELHW